MSENQQRHHAPRIALLNHKGGVGKTTLTFNLASALGSIGKKILVIDSDPQSNLTSFFVEDSVVDSLLDNSDSAKGNTIWSALRPIVEATGDIKNIKPYEMRNNIYLLPGDIKLAEFEEELPILWNDCFQSKIKGYRGISAISKLINRIAIDKGIDYIFYDTGPNVGALNRIISLDCDFYIVPAACDIFSLRAIRTLGHTLYGWIKSWTVLHQLSPSGMYIIPGRPTFLGYIPQRFKTYGGIITSDFSKLIPKIEKEIKSEIINQILPLGKELVYTIDPNIKLGDVKDFGPLTTNSQTSGFALWELSNLEKTRREQIKNTFLNIAQKIVTRINKHRERHPIE